MEHLRFISILKAPIVSKWHPVFVILWRHHLREGSARGPRVVHDEPVASPPHTRKYRISQHTAIAQLSSISMDSNPSSKDTFEAQLAMYAKGLR